MSSAEPTVVHHPDDDRFDLMLDGRRVGWIDTRPAGASLILAHTEVEDGHEGEGLGGTLVRGALEQIRDQGRTVIPTCPFAAAWIQRHPEWAEVVTPSMRRRLGV